MASKTITYKGKTAEIEINSSTCRGSGETTYEVTVTGKDNAYRYESEVNHLTDDVLMSFEAGFHAWVENPNPKTRTEQILADNGYS